MSAKKPRPAHHGELPDNPSQRDIAAAYGISRRAQWRFKQIASLPDDLFEAALASPQKPTTGGLVHLARRRAGCAPSRRRCPHCGGELP